MMPTNPIKGGLVEKESTRRRRRRTRQIPTSHLDPKAQPVRQRANADMVSGY
jgi:hypothetical protein